MEGDKLIQNAPECYQLLHEARRYHVLGNEMMSPRTRPRRYNLISDLKNCSICSQKMVCIAHEIVFLPGKDLNCMHFTEKMKRLDCAEHLRLRLINIMMSLNTKCNNGLSDVIK